MPRKDPAAVRLGRRGGRKTAARGAEYYRRINAMRKIHAGGRPKLEKQSDNKTA